MTTVREQIRAVLNGTTGYEPGLDALTVMPPADVDPALTSVLWDACARLWRGGWQPVELHRAIARKGDPIQAHLITDAVAAHLRGFARTAVDPRWAAQANTLGAKVWWTDDPAYLGGFCLRFKLDRVTALDVVLTLIGSLAGLPSIEVLVPPPGTAVRPAHTSRVDDRLLDRVRALLAKAESTEYQAEADAYMAKAQQLITRHSLDEALLAATAGDAAVVPFARRIGVDHPYESEKASLLNAVARANRCHTVWSPELGFVTVFGFDADIDAVDLLHTSLLVQANRLMTQAEPRGKVSRARAKAFRQSFLVAFAVGIGERLANAARSTVSDAASTGSDLLPVLASRDEQVQETMHKIFPQTVRARGARIDSLEGWDSGRDAADNAALHATS